MAENTRRFDEIHKVVSDTRQHLDDSMSTVKSRLSSHAHSSGSLPDATTGAKGIVQLAGDLGGTATSPTVPGLASKVGSVSAGDSSIAIGGTSTAPTVRVNFIPGDLFVLGSVNGTNGISYYVQSGPTSFRFYWDGININIVRNDLNSIVKTFVIDHPTDPARYLVHACTESPSNGVEYWGEATVTGGSAVVTLPAYFEALCGPDNRQVQVSVVLPDVDTSTPAGPDVDVDVPDPANPGKTKKQKQPGKPARPEHTMVPAAAASAPRNGQFRISCSGPDGTKVAWLVKAVRKDVPPLLVEPLKTGVDVFGDGPYRYYTVKGETR